MGSKGCVTMDFEEIVLSDDEHRALKKLSSVKRATIDKTAAEGLAKYGFISYRHESSPGVPMHPTGESDITDKGIAYYRYIRRRSREGWFERKAPVLIALASIIISLVSLYFSLMR